MKEGGVCGWKRDAGVMEGRSDGPEEEKEGPLEEAPAEEAVEGTSTEDKGGGIMVEEVGDGGVWEGKGAGEEIVLERGRLKVRGAGGAVDEVGGEGRAGVGRALMAYYFLHLALMALQYRKEGREMSPRQHCFFIFIVFTTGFIS
ncbi:hypothetical protein Taro_036373 [Colocasia esculenta]|uniref:Uncharacterized protein n=1 Tax=Colocasia esculenta TaxID=4460 RepID=A0A843W6L5_COLES|nr:hypothetical protein [Colocasia esculenta]